MYKTTLMQHNNTISCVTHTVKLQNDKIMIYKREKGENSAFYEFKGKK